MKFTSKVFVRWADLDAFGHVNNAVYLTYSELARVEWGGKQFAPTDPGSVLVEMTVAHSEVDYLRYFHGRCQIIYIAPVFKAF